jgi:hypothetical protein
MITLNTILTLLFCTTIRISLVRSKKKNLYTLNNTAGCDRCSIDEFCTPSTGKTSYSTTKGDDHKVRKFVRNIIRVLINAWRTRYSGFNMDCGEMYKQHFYEGLFHKYMLAAKIWTHLNLWSCQCICFIYVGFAIPLTSKSKLCYATIHIPINLPRYLFLKHVIY